MHARQHRARLLGTVCALAFASFVAGSTGCALIANISEAGGTDESVTGAGSKKPDTDPASAQQEGGTTAPPATCFADLSSDEHNCGVCGHDCAGSLCTSGLCAPTTIVSATNVRSIVADDQRLFFSNDHDVQSCPVASVLPMPACTSLVDAALVGAAVRAQNEGFDNGDNNSSNKTTTTTATVTPLDPRALAVFEGRVFVADSGNQAIVVCPETTSCSATSLAIVHVGDATYTGGIGIDSKTILWGESHSIGQADIPTPTHPRSGTFFLEEEAAARSISRIEMKRTGADYEDCVFKSPSGLFALASDDDAKPILISSDPSIRDFAIDAQFVYAARASSVVRFDLATLDVTPLLLLPPGTEITHIVADESGVYVSSVGMAGLTHLLRVRQGSADVLAVAPSVGAIALTKQWLYYATNDAIQRVSR